MEILKLIYHQLPVTKPSTYSFWATGDLEPTKYPFQNDKYNKLTNVELFELFFADDLLEKII